MPRSTRRPTQPQRRWPWQAAAIVLGIAVAVPAVGNFNLRLGMPAWLRFPLAPGQDTAPAVFSHWSHDQLTCFACHPSIFLTSRYTFTHAQMEAGAHCGACHDGVFAWSVADTECEVCHREPPRDGDERGPAGLAPPRGAPLRRADNLQAPKPHGRPNP